MPIHIICTTYSYWSRAGGHHSKVAHVQFTGTSAALYLDNDCGTAARACKHAVEALGVGEAWSGVLQGDDDVGYQAYKRLAASITPCTDEQATLELIIEHLRESLQAWKEHLGALKPVRLSLEAYKNEAHRVALSYGFMAGNFFEPTDQEYERMYDAGMTIDQAYGIICDLNASFTFEELFPKYLKASKS